MLLQAVREVLSRIKKAHPAYFVVTAAEGKTKLDPEASMLKDIQTYWTQHRQRRRDNRKRAEARKAAALAVAVTEEKDASVGNEGQPSAALPGPGLNEFRSDSKHSPRRG